MTKKAPTKKAPTKRTAIPDWQVPETAKYAVVNVWNECVHEFTRTKAEANAIARDARKRTRADWFLEFGTNITVETVEVYKRDYSNFPLRSVASTVRGPRITTKQSCKDQSAVARALGIYMGGKPKWTPHPL